MSARVKVARVVFASEDFFKEESSRIFVELWELGEQSHRTSNARLTANPHVLELYEQWRKAYRNFYQHLSLRDDFDPRGSANRARDDELALFAQLKRELETCSNHLIIQFNDWLSNQVSFRDGVENWLGDRFNLDDDEIRIAIESDDPKIRRLPWQAWNLLDRFDRAELSIGDTRHDSCSRSPTNTRQNRNLKLLAVFGYEGGLNLDRDKKTIQALANVEADFLHQPTLQELKAKLRQSQWDSLYFGGHSASDCEGKTGVLYLNSQEPIEIGQLKGALKTAVRDGGLQLGIFNSCDGLGLASELEDVHFPLSIVMREPVPNEVAQRFLKSFLQAYTRGKPLYLALRQARLLLEEDSEELPYLSWLPAIAHDSSTNPLLWQDSDLGPPKTIISIPSESQPDRPSVQKQSNTSPEKEPPLSSGAIAIFKPKTILGGSYEIINELGRGGFSVTYLAKALDLPGQPHCTVKQLKPMDPTIDMAKASSLFEREAQTLFDLGSRTDRIPTLYASFEEGGEFYLVQEYIAGEELEEELRSQRRLNESETLELLGNILEALEVIHRKDIIHRDLKPSNLMRRQSDDKVVLIDFGAVKEVIALATFPGAEVPRGRGTIVGSPGFMAPEQSLGYPQLASDIFSVGAIALRAITGKAPEQVLTAEGITGRLIRQDDVQVSDEMENLLRRMTHTEFQERFVDAAEALKAVKQLQNLREQKSVKDSRTIRTPTRKFMPRIIHNIFGIFSKSTSLPETKNKVEPSSNIGQESALPLTSVADFSQVSIPLKNLDALQPKDDPSNFILEKKNASDLPPISTSSSGFSISASEHDSCIDVAADLDCNSETSLSKPSDRESDLKRSPVLDLPDKTILYADYSILPTEIYKHIENTINSILGPIGSLILNQALTNNSNYSDAVDQILLSIPKEEQENFYLVVVKALNQLPQKEGSTFSPHPPESLNPNTSTDLQQTLSTPALDREVATNISSNSFTVSEFQMEELMKHLVEHIGPLASLTLNSAIDSANSPQELVRSLLEWLPQDSREVLRGLMLNLLLQESNVADLPHRPSSYPPHKPPGQAYETTDIEQESVNRLFVDFCQSELTKHIGPIAAIAIQDSLSSYTPGDNRESLVARLTTYLPDPKAIADFRQAVRNWRKG